MFIFPKLSIHTQSKSHTTAGFERPSNGVPSWMTAEGYYMLKAGYLLSGETPWDAYVRLAQAAARALHRPNLSPRFFELMWRGWLGPASPVLANLGTNRGYPISCNSTHIHDSLDGIFEAVSELAHLSSKGAGVGIYMGDVRGRGTPIRGGYTSEGVIPWCKIIDSTTVGVSQNGVRKGASAVYLPFGHPDIKEFINMRRPTGDENQRCMNIHHAVCLTDDDMHAIMAGGEARELFGQILRARIETGEPYLFFADNVNKVNPVGYEEHGLKVKTSNICLLGEELVVTKDGSRPIKDLVGKTVEVWDGNAWTSVDSFEYKGHVNQLVEVEYRDGTRIKTTLDHKFPLVDGRFVKAKHLKAGDNVETHSVEVSGTIEIKGAYAKGFMIAEATAEKRTKKPVLMIYEPKQMCAERIIKDIESIAVDDSADQQCITEVCLLEGSIKSKSPRKRLTGLTARRGELLDWCSSYKQKLPDDYLNWTRVSKLEFLAGLFDGDGCVNGKGYQLASIHKTMLEQVHNMLKSLGVQSKISLLRPAGTSDFGPERGGVYNTAAVYRITISSTNSYKLADMCKFSRLAKVERPGKKYQPKPTHGQVVGVRIIDVDPVATYCCEVPTTHKFALADGRMTGNCSEITAHTDPKHTFVCCLSSMNLARWDEWRNTDAVYWATWFLDGVMQEYINKIEGEPHFANSWRFATKSRMLGLGVMGWHSLLQERGLPFESFGASLLNRAVFRHLADESNRASRDMAAELGEPEWCKGTGLRNTHTITCAPTVTNSIICGHVSPGIEPFAANSFEKKTSRGSMFFHNPTLQRLLAERGQDTDEVWDSITAAKGSVQHLECLTPEEREVFYTAREINQMAIIKQAAERQKEMDRHRQGQSQSVNLFFTAEPNPTYFALVHFEAWRLGLKTLYYCRSQAILQAEGRAGELAIKRQQELESKLLNKTTTHEEAEECLACQG